MDNFSRPIRSRSITQNTREPHDYTHPTLPDASDYVNGHLDFDLGKFPDPVTGNPLLWDTDRLHARPEKVLEGHEIDDGLYEGVSLETCDPNPNVQQQSHKIIRRPLSVPVIRIESPAVPEFEGSRFIQRRPGRAASSGAAGPPRQVLRLFPEDRVAANKPIDHEWFESRRQQRTSKVQRSIGPTFDDILLAMEDVDSSGETRVKKEDLPPSAQPAGACRLSGFFQKAVCARPRN